jgi:hypothetical protein
MPLVLSAYAGTPRFKNFPAGSLARQAQGHPVLDWPKELATIGAHAGTSGRFDGL